MLTISPKVVLNFYKYSAKELTKQIKLKQKKTSNSQ